MEGGCRKGIVTVQLGSLLGKQTQKNGTLGKTTLFISLRLNKMRWLKSICSTSPNRMSLQSIEQSFLSMSRCPNFNYFFSSLWILSYLNLLNPYIFISRVCSCEGAFSIFYFKNHVHGWCYRDNSRLFWSNFYLCTYTHTWLKRTHRICHPWICKTGTSLPLLAEYWQISSSRKLNCSRRRYNISMQVRWVTQSVFMIKQTF